MKFRDTFNTIYQFNLTFIYLFKNNFASSVDSLVLMNAVITLDTVEKPSEAELKITVRRLANCQCFSYETSAKTVVV